MELYGLVPVSSPQRGMSGNTWKFPENISLEDVALYTREFDGMPLHLSYLFDLTGTNYIHSSFIGFLIDVKQKLDRSDGKLSLEISSSLVKIFRMLGINNFLYNNVND